MPELEPFTTSDTPFAAYLLCHSHKYVGMRPDPNDKKRKVFVFIKQENTELLTNDYYEGSPQIDPRTYYAKTRIVHRHLRDEDVRT